MKKDIHPDNYRLCVFKDMSTDYAILTKSCAETKDTIKTVYYVDDGLGNINLLTEEGSLLAGNVATIDYTSGKISKFSPVRILSIISTYDYVRFSGDVANQDIYSDNTQIILFEEVDINVTMNSETL